MSTESIQQLMTKEDRAKFERGAELLGQLQTGRHFDDYWVPIGDGLLALRNAVMASSSRFKRPQGGPYNKQFGQACVGTPYAHMKKVERSNLLFCMANLSRILEMRAEWEPSEKATINSPTGMAKRLREYLKVQSGESPRLRNSSPFAVLKDKYETVVRQVAEVEERLAEAKQLDGSLFDLHQSTAGEIATSIVGELSTRKGGSIKARKIADGILAQLTKVKSAAAG